MTLERIRWNDDETERLAAAALPALVADPKLGVVDAVRRVQDTVLPAERRRNLKTLGMIPVALRTTLEARRDAALGKTDSVSREAYEAALAATAAAEQGEHAADAEVQRLQAENASLRAHIVALEARPPAPTKFDVLKELFTDIAADAMARLRAVPGGPEKVEVKIPPLDPQASERPLGGAPRHDPSPSPSERPRPPVILCVGVKAQDRQRLESSMNGRDRLKFWTDDAYSNLEDKARGADMCFIMMKMASHDTVAKVAKANENFQRVPGHAVDRLKEEIEAWLTRRQ